MIAALREPGRYAANGAGQAAARLERVDLVETHISCVLLAGDYAYKIKKPVNLGFLDFTSLAARRFYCEEEVRLNRRTAPALYLGVVAITGSASDPVVGGEGTPIDYAVKMRRFSQDVLLDGMARSGMLATDCLDALGLRLAEFHQSLEPARVERAYASPAQILDSAMQNFDQIRAVRGAAKGDDALAMLRSWTEREHARLAGEFEARKRDGFVRECHGDLHLGNIALLEGAPTLFDCIEFNAAFRWIDVMNEVAFLVMDLEEHRLPKLAFRFLNNYLEVTGDYAGLRVLRFYSVYRALIRAKVVCIRGQQPGAGAKARTRAGEEYAHYLRFAQAAAAAGRGALVIMHGLSGSGKTTLARRLAESLQAVHLRSDVERKRLHGLASLARTASALAGGVYAPQDTERTYARLADFARHAIASGYPAIVDASFLAARHRTLFRSLASDIGVPFAIASCAAPDEVLRERVGRRETEGVDASEAGLAVLERQFATQEPFAGNESADAVAFDSRDTDCASTAAAEALARRLGLMSR